MRATESREDSTFFTILQAFRYILASYIDELQHNEGPLFKSGLCAALLFPQEGTIRQQISEERGGGGGQCIGPCIIFTEVNWSTAAIERWGRKKTYD